MERRDFIKNGAIATAAFN
ncbi:MAG: twin-arginine translocation signal domain-containing protein, partial [Pedobacter sp.]